MAKAKKPVSGSKSPAQASKKGAGAQKGPETAATGAPSSKATQASASKPAVSSSKTPVAKQANDKAVEQSGPAKTDTKKAVPMPKTGRQSASSKPDAEVVKEVSTFEKGTSVKSTEPKSAPIPAAQQREPEKNGSVFWPLVTGGVVAGVIGFGVSEFNLLNTRTDTSNIENTLASQQDQIAALEGAEMPATDLGGIEASIASVSDMVTDLEARLAELESRPVPTGDGTGVSPEYAEQLAQKYANKYAEELGALQASVEEQKGEIDRLLENALSVEQATANSARTAAAQGALTQIVAALNTGSDFSQALGTLSENGIDDVPAALADIAAAGVPTLLSLQTGFPDVARAALSVARASGSDEGTGGVGSFLKRQLGARSVAPREGSDPDAILSRAEAAVRDGSLADALSEIDTLPAQAQEAMSDWLASARMRSEAEIAVQDLSQRLTAN